MDLRSIYTHKVDNLVSGTLLRKYVRIFLIWVGETLVRDLSDYGNFLERFPSSFMSSLNGTPDS